MRTRPDDDVPGLDAALLDRLERAGREIVHIITIATKPDIIKQAPVHAELRSRGETVLLCHTGQHYDENYSGAMLREFGLEADIHLGVDGPLETKAAQIIERFGAVVAALRGRGLTPVPYIHGDTLTSMAVGVGAYLHRVACVHVEAGIRTLTPRSGIYAGFLEDHRRGTFDWDDYLAMLRDPHSYERGSNEPFPEQFNTRVSDAASGYHAAPVELARDFLLDEGFRADTIEVVGNTVVEATAAALRDAERATILTTYPQLASGEFIRFCIHRRENTESRERFTVLFDAMETLVREGRSVLLIRLFGTDEAIDRFGLADRLRALTEEFSDTFISSPVWPHYRDVIAAMLQCALVATDSGSMQEEMNLLGIGCVTLRFGTDRAESLFAGGNVLAPPIDAGFVAAVIRSAAADSRLRNVPKIYGTEASRLLVDGVLARVRPGDGVYAPEEHRLGR